MKKIIIILTMFILLLCNVAAVLNEPVPMEHWSFYNTNLKATTSVQSGGSWNDFVKLYDNQSIYSPPAYDGTYSYTGQAGSYIEFNLSTPTLIESVGISLYSFWCYGDGVYNISCSSDATDNFNQTLYYADYYGVNPHPLNLSVANLTATCQRIRYTIVRRCGETSGDCSENCLINEVMAMAGTPVAGDPAPYINVTFPGYNSTQYTQNIYINFTTNVSSQCTINDTLWSEITTDGMTHSWQETNAEDDYYNVKITCNNSVDLTKGTNYILNFTILHAEVTILNPVNDTRYRSDPFNVSFNFNYNTYQCTLFMNNTPYVNITSGALLSQADNYTLNYTFGIQYVADHTFYVNCANSTVDGNSTIQIIHIDTDFVPPFINITNPVINYTDNKAVDINATTNESSTCTINDTNWMVYKTGGVLHDFTDSGAVLGRYSIMINCTDPSNNSNTVTWNIGKDFISPGIIIHSPTGDINNDGSIDITVNITDDLGLHHYKYNITYNSGFSDIILYMTNKTVSGKEYIIDDDVYSTNFTNDTTLTFSIKACDSHTNTKIKDADEIHKTARSLYYIFGSTIINVTSINGNEAMTETEKLNDRYTFKFKYSVPGKHKYLLQSNKEISYLKNSMFPGHFIIDGHWIDFNSPGAVKNDVKVKPQLDGSFIIEIKNEGTEIQFNSIGELNCNYASSSFLMYNENDRSFYIDMNTLEGVALLFLILFLYLGLLIIGIYFNNFIFKSLAVFVGIILGLYMFNVHVFLTLSLVLTNTVFFVITAFAKHD